MARAYPPNPRGVNLRSFPIRDHPQRQKIVDAIAAGKPYQQISDWTEPYVSIEALKDFKKRSLQAFITKTHAAHTALQTNGVASDTEAITKVAMHVASDPFILAAIKQMDRRARWMQDVEDAGDYSDEGPDYNVLAKLDRNDQTGLELHARLAGRLDAGPSHTNIMIVCPAAPEVRSVPGEAGVTIDIDPRPSR